jgi:hypothetical protein
MDGRDAMNDMINNGIEAIHTSQFEEGEEQGEEKGGEEDMEEEEEE